MWTLSLLVSNESSRCCGIMIGNYSCPRVACTATEPPTIPWVGVHRTTWSSQQHVPKWRVHSGEIVEVNPHFGTLGSGSTTSSTGVSLFKMNANVNGVLSHIHVARNIVEANGLLPIRRSVSSEFKGQEVALPPALPCRHTNSDSASNQFPTHEIP